MEPALDLTQTPQDGQYAALAGALERMRPDTEIVVLTTGVPRALLRRLIDEQWGRFEWTPLSEEAGHRRSLLRRRKSAPVSVAEYFSADHERCDALYAGMEAEAQAGNEVRSLFRDFDAALRRHFAMEEEGFFPQFDRKTGMGGQGPTAMMREEHAQMRSLLDRMAMAAAEQDLESLLSAGETLLMMIQQHNMKEEQMLYPMADEVFGAEIEDVLKAVMLY